MQRSSRESARARVSSCGSDSISSGCTACAASGQPSKKSNRIKRPLRFAIAAAIEEAVRIVNEALSRSEADARLRAAKSVSNPSKSPMSALVTNRRRAVLGVLCGAAATALWPSLEVAQAATDYMQPDANRLRCQ